MVVERQEGANVFAAVVSCLMVFNVTTGRTHALCAEKPSTLDRQGSPKIQRFLSAKFCSVKYIHNIQPSLFCNHHYLFPEPFIISYWSMDFS